MNRKQKARIKAIYMQPITQLWLNIVNMPKEDRKAFILYINSLNNKNCGFADYYAKYFLNRLIDSSECYHTTFNK
jgi:hypothetical protein